MNIETRPWDVCEHLDSREAIAAYLDAVLEECDPDLLAAALADVARAVGPARLAAESGLPAETVDRILAGSLILDIATVDRVLRGVGVRLSVAADAVSAPGAVDRTGLR